MTVETSYGIITVDDYYPVNQQEGGIIMEHLKEQPCEYQKLMIIQSL